MTYRLLLDENVEHDVLDLLTGRGHDVEHVDFVLDLGKGATDHEIGAYSRTEDRLVVTYDDDFVLVLDESTFRAVLYAADGRLAGIDVAGAVHGMSKYHPQKEVTGVEYLDRWA